MGTGKLKGTWRGADVTFVTMSRMDFICRKYVVRNRGGENNSYMVNAYNQINKECTGE